jgi:SAM-dependent methyltransferase
MRLSGRKGLKYRLLPLIRLGFRITGRPWNDFYTWLINYQERHTRIEDLVSRYRRDTSQAPVREKGLYDISLGENYVAFLREQGLQPHHDFLDFGCGYGRMTIPLLRYLEPQRYVGVDLSAERIRLARDFVTLESLDVAQPAFYVATRDNQFSYLAGRKFDVIWARAVLGHMPVKEIRECLLGLRDLLKSGGVFIGDYDLLEDADAGVGQTNVKTFRVGRTTMRQLIEEIGFVYNEIPDWEERLRLDERREYICMMRLTLAPAEQA